MEEILASIRRIISEQDAPEAAPAPVEKPAASPAPETPEPVVARPEPEVIPEPVIIPAPQPAAAPEPEPEVLELTRMVEDDGNIVDLADEAETAFVSEEPAITDNDFAAAVAARMAETGDSFTDNEEEAGFSTAEPDIIDAEVESVIETADFHDDTTAALMEVADAMAADDDTPFTPADDFIEDVAFTELDSPDEETPEDQPQETQEPPAMSDDSANLVSPNAMAASLAALSRLEAAVKPAATPSTGSGLTIDSMARELLKPMLKEWLDTNLPGIVDNIVREEIKRLMPK
jgi:hypothetical protein